MKTATHRVLGRPGAQASAGPRDLLALLTHPRPPQLSRVARVLVVPVTVFVVASAQYALLPQPSIAPFVMFPLGIALVAWMSGRWVGILTAIFLAALGNVLFIAPNEFWSNAPAALHATLLFACVGTLLAVLCGTFRESALEAARNEDLVRLSHERFRRLVEVSAQIVWVAAPNGEMRADSPSWRAFTGRSYEQWRGWRWLDAIHADDREHAVSVWREALETRAPHSLEFRMLNAQGEYRHMLTRAAPILDPDGAVREWIGMSTDITEQKRGEDELRAREAWFRQLAESLPQLVWTARPDGHVDYYNQRQREFEGLTDHGEEGWSWAPVLHPDDRERTVQAWQHSLATGEPYDLEHRAKRADGSYAWQLSRATALRDDEGNIVRWFGTATDIQQLKQIEAELVDKEQALRESDRQKNEFLAMLAHELRNPLAPIRTSAHVLERAIAGSDQARRAARALDRQVGHLTRLVDDLLDVTRVSRGKIGLHKQRLELRELVRRVADDHAPSFSEASVELRVELCTEPMFVQGDETRLAQIVGNLLSNATKFTPRGGHVTMRAALADERTCMVTVRDDGEGVEPSHLSRMFEPFYQVDKTLDRSRGGLGLGLSVVKGLVELHGGSVRAHSDGIGKGAELVVLLPRDVRAEQAQVVEPIALPHAPRRRVLVIEDNFDAADSLRDALELGQHEVELAYDGPLGVEKAKSFAPDVILCDIGLPRMNGYDVARAIRREPALRGVRLVALSGYASREDVERCTEAGFDAHLAKPPTLEQLERTLAHP